MTALLGRPSSAILGHSLPALLGGHAELGRVLLGKQPFNSLEMELKTARGTRWISIAGDPIIDTAGRFEGFRGVGSDITEVRQTQERLTHLANMDVLSGLPNRGRVRQLLGEALRAATTNAARALGLSDRGVLRVGARADFVVTGKVCTPRFCSLGASGMPGAAWS